HGRGGPRRDLGHRGAAIALRGAALRATGGDGVGETRGRHAGRRQSRSRRGRANRPPGSARGSGRPDSGRPIPPRSSDRGGGDGTTGAGACAPRLLGGPEHRSAAGAVLVGSVASGSRRRIRGVDERPPADPTNTQFLLHLSGYRWAAETFGPLRARQVLDVASGEGYGSGLLAASGATVVGVDLDAAVLSRARAAYPAARF